MALAGELAAGRYRLIRAIGAGGMGTVWLARHERIGRDVALKISPEGADSALRERFVREAHIAGEVCHRNVVSVLDAGEIDGEARPFLVMELLRGQPLADRMRARDPLPPTEILEIAIGVCRGLEAIHARGIVHRDVKPENIFLADVPGEGLVPKLVDFGISLRADKPEERSLRRIVGTPAYMSPEQARGDDDVDGRADVWALGVVMYEALAGRAPFEASDVDVLLAMVLDDEPRPLRAPPCVVAIVERCLTKDRRKRYANAEALLLDLEDAMAELTAAPVSQTAFARTRGASLRPPAMRGRITISAGHVLSAAAFVALVAMTLVPKGRANGTTSDVLRAPLREIARAAAERVGDAVREEKPR